MGERGRGGGVVCVEAVRGGGRGRRVGFDLRAGEKKRSCLFEDPSRCSSKSISRRISYDNCVEKRKGKGCVCCLVFGVGGASSCDYSVASMRIG